MPKEGLHCICLSVVLIDSVFKMDKNYYPQVTRHVTEELEISSDSDESDEVSFLKRKI